MNNLIIYISNLTGISKRREGTKKQDAPLMIYSSSLMKIRFETIAFSLGKNDVYLDVLTSLSSSKTSVDLDIE